MPETVDDASGCGKRARLAHGNGLIKRRGIG
jgi:hypothetical protein